ncbi:MAG: hypothetical protein IJO27_03375 [Bacilli bacterium]|nr:hypothetical protein [Bacilli bacterium]
MKNKQSNEIFSEDWVPVKQILNGMIQLQNGMYVSGIKISPKNIFIQEKSAQESVIGGLRDFYNTIDYEFWLIIADRPVDIHMYLSELQILYNNTSNPAARKLVMQDINKANMFMSTEYNVVDTEYYIVFQEKRLELIQKKIRNLITGLANAGLNSTQVSNSDLRMILDNFLNGGAQTNFGTVM